MCWLATCLLFSLLFTCNIHVFLFYSLVTLHWITLTRQGKTMQKIQLCVWWLCVSSALTSVPLLFSFSTDCLTFQEKIFVKTLSWWRPGQRKSVTTGWLVWADWRHDVMLLLQCILFPTVLLVAEGFHPLFPEQIHKHLTVTRHGH